MLLYMPRACIVAVQKTRRLTNEETANRSLDRPLAASPHTLHVHKKQFIQIF